MITKEWRSAENLYVEAEGPYVSLDSIYGDSNDMVIPSSLQ